jgi:Esterase-like activity of phytase
MTISFFNRRVLSVALAMAPVLHAHADIQLIATSSISGTYQDLSDATSGPLENGVPGNRLGGMGSAIAYAGGDTFLFLPDRGPNAVTGYGGAPIDNTVSYINRFETFTLRLLQNTEYNPANPSVGPADVIGLPFILTPQLKATTLLSSPKPLTYGAGGSAAGTESTGRPTRSGVPPLNFENHTFYFTGRSDGFDPKQSSTWPFNARFDTEGLRVSNDGRSVFISDEYGPYVYQFDRATGQRIRYFTLPSAFAVAHPNTTTALETGTGGTALNTSGRVANKGAEGLAITPDGRTLVVALQSPLLQDGGTSGSYGASGIPYTRMVTIDIASGKVTHQFAYPLTTVKGSAISELLAVNDHQFLVDERDATGFETATDDNSPPKEKTLYEIDLKGATDVSDITDLRTGGFTPVTKSAKPFLDIVAVLTAAGLDPATIPSKLEGIAFGPDLELAGSTHHTLYLTNDNDFVSYVAKDAGSSANVLAPADNPNRIFVFAFVDGDLPLNGKVQPQRLPDTQHDGHYDAPYWGGFGPPSGPGFYWP